MQSLSEAGGKWQVSSDGGTRPRWTRDGKRLFFLDPNLKVMAVDIDTTSTFAAGIPRVIETPPIKRVNGNLYDLSPDGRKVLIISPLEKSTAGPIVLVQNWTAEARK